MTISACFLKAGCFPVFLTDVLLTIEDQGEFTGNYKRWYNQFSNPTVNHREVMHMTKIRILNENYCIAWAGNVVDALEVIRNIEIIINNHPKELVDEQVERFFESLDKNERYSLILVGFSQENSKTECVWWTNLAKEYDRAGVKGYVAGSGISMLENSNISANMGKAIEEPLGVAMQVLLTCLGNELYEHRFNEYRLGAYYEITTWDSGWRKLKVPVNLIKISEADGERKIDYISHSRIFYNDINPLCFSLNPFEFLEEGIEEFNCSILNDPFRKSNGESLKVKLEDILKEPIDFEVTLAIDKENPQGAFHKYSMLDLSDGQHKENIHDFLSKDFRKRFRI